MSRHRASGSYGHRIEVLSFIHGEFRLWWTVDRYYPDSRLRFPRNQSRDADEKGARRFAKRWGILFPSKEEGKK